MKKYDHVYDHDIVLATIKAAASGSRNARTKEFLLKQIMLSKMNERKFRQIVSDLKHAGLIFSTSNRGYWYVDPECKDQKEWRVAQECWLEMRSRAMDMLTDCDKHLKRLHDRILYSAPQSELFDNE